jgi:ABC-type amino acid transport substrate-binding protein
MDFSHQYSAARFVVVLCFICFWIILSPTTFAEEPQANLGKGASSINDIIVNPHDASFLDVGVSEILPWGGVDSEGQIFGISARLYHYLAHESGLNLRLVIYPYTRLIRDINQDRVDLGFLFQNTVDDIKVQDLGSVTSIPIVISSLSGSLPIDSLTQLQGGKVAHMRSSKFGGDYDDHPDFTRVHVNNIMQGLNLLFHKRVDALASSEHILFYGMREQSRDVSKIKVIMHYGEANARLYSSRLCEQDKLTRLQSALTRLRESGRLDELFSPKNAWSMAQPIK